MVEIPRTICCHVKCAACSKCEIVVRSVPEKIIGIYVLPYNYNNNNLIISGIFTHNIKYKEINFSFRRPSYPLTFFS